MSVREYDPTDYFPCPECRAAWDEDCAADCSHYEPEDEESENGRSGMSTTAGSDG